MTPAAHTVASRPTPAQRWRLVGNWVNLSTPLGLIVARVGRARMTRSCDGLHLASGYRASFPYAPAFTVGSVLITRTDWGTASDDLIAHERAHTWQWLLCGGLPFLPAYAAAMGWSWLRTGDRGAANVFEQWAGLARGGYRELPRRPLRSGMRAAWVAGVRWATGEVAGGGLRRRWGRSPAAGPSGPAAGSPASAAGA